jgi:hypothetical protein
MRTAAALGHSRFQLRSDFRWPRALPILPLAARTATAAQLIDCSKAHVYELMNRGEFSCTRADLFSEVLA